MNWNEYRHHPATQRMLPFFECISTRKWLDFFVDKETKKLTCAFATEFEKTFPDMVEVVAVHGVASAIEVKCTSDVYSQGVHIFRGDVRNFEACEYHDLNINFDEYSQPFPTVVIEFPQDYRKKRIAQAQDIMQEPSFAILSWDEERKIILASVHLSSWQVWSMGFWQDEGVTTLEDVLTKSKDYNYEGALQMTPDEVKNFHIILRVALNVCLFAMEFGCEKIGPENQSYYDRCYRHLQKALKSKNKEQITRARRELRLCPIVYSFPPSLKLYTEEKEGPSTPTGITVRPHWRRGHRQYYWVSVPSESDPETKIKKRIRKTKKAVLVNKHLLVS